MKIRKLKEETWERGKSVAASSLLREASQRLAVGRCTDALSGLRQSLLRHPLFVLAASPTR